jgi:hypothetical protein
MNIMQMNQNLLLQKRDLYSYLKICYYFNLLLIFLNMFYSYSKIKNLI